MKYWAYHKLIYYWQREVLTFLLSFKSLIIVTFRHFLMSQQKWPSYNCQSYSHQHIHFIEIVTWYMFSVFEFILFYNRNYNSLPKYTSYGLQLAMFYVLTFWQGYASFYEYYMQITLWMYPGEPRNLWEEVLSEGPFLKVSWTIGCGVQGDAVHNVPSLVTVALPSISITNSKNKYIFSQEPSPRHFFVNISWENHMTIFIIIVIVFVRIFDLVWVMNHFKL